MIGGWQHSISHPGIADLITVSAYFVAAVFTALAAAHAPSSTRPQERSLWRAGTFALVALALNELLDLQTLLISVGRAEAKSGGWYDQRHNVEYVFAIVLGAALLAAGASIVRRLKHTHSTVWVAFGGFVSIALFAMLRASTILHLGLGNGITTIIANLENIGIFMVGAAAAIYTEAAAPTE